MNAEYHLGKIRWQCRRGMLELDIILEKFFDQHFVTLTVSEKKAFVELLNQSDQTLYVWLLGGKKPTQSQDAKIVTKIRDALKLNAKRF